MRKKVLHKNQPAASRRSGLLWIGAGLLLLLLGSLVFWNRVNRTPAPPPQVTGAPRLAVDQSTLDEGDVPLGKTIRSVFRLQNVGDQPLTVLDEPQVEVVEGC